MRDTKHNMVQTRLGEPGDAVSNVIRTQDCSSCQNSIGGSVSQVVNMYVHNPMASGSVAGMTREALGNQGNSFPVCPQREGSENNVSGRKNSWFQAGDFHSGGAAPSGRNTPEFWDGTWEGRAAPELAPRRPPLRSAIAKQARRDKKKEKQEQISAKAHGNVNSVLPNTDTPEKRKLRSGAADLHNILKNKRLEYGADPGRVSPQEAVDCARLGSLFLELAPNGDHYSTRKFLRAELMKERKTREDTSFQGYLAEYQSRLTEYRACGQNPVNREGATFRPSDDRHTLL